MKFQCDKHGCSELLCGCSTGALEEECPQCDNKGDYFEQLRAKDKLINKLLGALEFYAGPDCDETGRAIIKDGVHARQVLREVEK